MDYALREIDHSPHYQLTVQSINKLFIKRNLLQKGFFLGSEGSHHRRRVVASSCRRVVFYNTSMISVNFSRVEQFEFPEDLTLLNNPPIKPDA